MTGSFVWWTDNDLLVVGYDNGDGTYTAPQESGNTIRLYCNKTYDEFTSTSNSLLEACPLPELFHRYIVDGAIAEGYALPGTDKGMLMLFEQRFRDGIARAQQYSSRERVKDDMAPAPYNIFQVTQ